MPAPRGMTLVDAVSEVLARCGQLDEDVSNPTLDAEARRHINAAQRQLQVEHDWLRQERTVQIAFAAGQRYADLPADARYQQLDTAWWVSGSHRFPLRPGIDRNDMSDGTASIPDAYDIRAIGGLIDVIITAPGTGYSSGTAVISGGNRSADGSDPVVTVTAVAGAITEASVIDSGSGWLSAPTITAPVGSGAILTSRLGTAHVIEINPPSDGGLLEVTFRASASVLSEDDDRLALDDEAVIGRAAWLLATVKRLPFARDILAAHNGYVGSLRSQQRIGQAVSLSGWRRDRR